MAATREPGPDGTYVVNLEVESRKFRADGEGVETEIPVDDWIDIAVFGEREPGSSPDGKLLALEKRKIEAAETVFVLVVDEEPRRAGIDPFTKLIDPQPGQQRCERQRRGRLVKRFVREAARAGRCFVRSINRSCALRCTR